MIRVSETHINKKIKTLWFDINIEVKFNIIREDKIYNMFQNILMFVIQKLELVFFTRFSYTFEM